MIEENDDITNDNTDNQETILELRVCLKIGF